jgi:hypothetical protein
MLGQIKIHDHHANDLRHVLLYSCLHVCYHLCTFECEEPKKKKNIAFSLPSPFSSVFRLRILSSIGNRALSSPTLTMPPFLYNFMDVLKHNLFVASI